MPTVIVSLGASRVLFGNPNYEHPKVTHSIVGRFRGITFTPGTGFRDRYAGDEAWHKRGVLRLTQPISRHEHLEPDDDFEWLAEYVVGEAAGAEGGTEIDVVVVADPMMGAAAREAICKAAFSNDMCQSVAIVCQPAMALRSGPSDTNTTTGLVVRLGSTSCDAIPVVDGQSLCMSMATWNKGLESAVDAFTELLQKHRGYCFSTRAEREIVREMYREFAAVAETAEVVSSFDSCDGDEVQYELPDGQVITIGRERIMASEAIFGHREEGRSELSEMVHRSIQRCPAQWRDEVASNIVVYGTVAGDLKGFVERLMREVGLPMRILPAYAAWKGAGLVDWGEVRVVHRDEFDATGPSVINLGFF